MRTLLVGTVCLLALSGCGLSGGRVSPGTEPAQAATSAGAADGVVPWISAAAGPAPTATPTPVPTPVALPACRSTNLGVRAGFTGGAALDLVSQIVFTNHGSTSCALTGFPTSVRLLDAAGRPVTEYTVSLTDDSYGPSPPNGGVELMPSIPDGATGADAVPGQAVLLVKTTTIMCGRAVVSSVVVGLRDGGYFRVPIRFSPDNNGDCQTATPALSSFQSIVRQTPEVPIPPDVTVTYHLPPQLQAGSVLQYTVSLNNVSGHVLTFNPCPGYTESLKAFGFAERHLLNCAVAPSLAIGQSRTFAMEMSVPQTPQLVTNQDLLTWNLDLPFQCVNSPGPGGIGVGR